MSVDTQAPPATAAARVLPERIDIPPMRGEMLQLRPAMQQDLPLLDEIDSYYNASMITGKDQESERAMVHDWVARSEAWSQGRSSHRRAAFDPQSRGTIAWSIVTGSGEASDEDDGAQTFGITAAFEHNTTRQHEHQSKSTDQHDDLEGGSGHAQRETEEGLKVIGMIFLIDIDPWANSARIQVILGKDYRGRGYSRDAMPRVMTYGFAPAPVGLSLHRIWVAVPSINTRSLSVYTSLGFVQSGASRDGMWDELSGKYQDLIVMDTLVDEYDPLGSLEAFGMRVFEDNPGVAQALEAREAQETSESVRESSSNHDPLELHATQPPQQTGSGTDTAREHLAPGATGVWPTAPQDVKHSHRAWWRNMQRDEQTNKQDSDTRGEEQQS